MSQAYHIYNRDCYGLRELPKESIHALVSDPPYGISYQAHYWDKDLPDPKIWQDAYRVLKPGSYALIFSSVRLMHRLLVQLEDQGFLIRDILQWVYLNGMPKSRNVGLSIDKILGIPSEEIGTYQYVQGYQKGGAPSYTHTRKKSKKRPASPQGKQYDGAGLGLKPAYEPILMVQKPLQTGLTVAENILKFGTGALNLEETRIPYAPGEKNVGHNPHPKGRVASNIIRSEAHQDTYDKFFVIPKVRQHAEAFNDHPTLKPVDLMYHLVRLVSFPGQTVLDPFMGSGSTGIACVDSDRQFWGYEIEPKYFKIAQTRLELLLDKPLSDSSVLLYQRQRAQNTKSSN